MVRADLIIERFSHNVLLAVEQHFAVAGLHPDRSVLVRCESRAIELAQSMIPEFLDSVVSRTDKEILDEACRVMANAVKCACREAEEYERYNPIFCSGEAYNVSEGRDL